MKHQTTAQRFRAAPALSLSLAATFALGAPIRAQDPDAATPGNASEQEEVHTLASFETKADFVPAETTRELSPRSKLGGSVLDVPRSVNTIERARIEERGAQSIQDALTYTPGVMAGPYGLDSRLDSAMIRGVDPLNYRDGFQALFGWYNNTRADIYTLESVEIVKGPASVLYGQGALGGMVNSVSKLPREQTVHELEIQLGNHDRRQVALDLGGMIDTDGKFLYRVVSIHRESGTQVDHVDDDAKILMPSFTWRPSSETSLTLLANLQENKGGQTLQFLPNEGTLLPGRDIPTNTFIGEPGWDRYDTEQDAFSLFLDHRFNDTWTLALNARNTNGTADYKSHWVTYGFENPVIPQDGNVMRTIYDAPASTDAFVWNAIASASFGGDALSHELSFGIDAQDVSIDTDSYYGWAAGGRINIHQPQYGNLADRGAILDTPANNSDQFGLFVRDQITLDRWLLSIGLRRDQVETRAEGAAEPSIDASATTGDLGLMYRFANGFSPYLSYAESFEPLGSGIGLDGSEIQLDPKSGSQYELGFKYQPENATSLFTAAIFDIAEKERPISNGVFVTQENVSIQGIEIEAQTRWKDIYLQAGYSYIDATDGDGQKLVTIADHQAVAWLTYQPSLGDWQNFKAGFGLRYAGKRWDGIDSLAADPYTLLDAMIGYDFENLRLQLNVNNLADETFVASTTGGRSYYGARRTVTLTAKYRF